MKYHLKLKELRESMDWFISKRSNHFEQNTEEACLYIGKKDFKIIKPILNKKKYKNYEIVCIK
jgi:dihydrofolate reductase